MYVILNDQKVELDSEKNLEDFLASQTLDGIFAIAINENFIPKANYTSTTLQEGDHIELVSPMQGG